MCKHVNTVIEGIKIHDIFIAAEAKLKYKNYIFTFHLGAYSTSKNVFISEAQENILS